MLHNIYDNCLVYSRKVLDLQFFLLANAQSLLTHFFPLHSFSTSWKQKILRFSVFRWLRKNALGTNGLIALQVNANGPFTHIYVKAQVQINSKAHEKKSIKSLNSFQMCYSFTQVWDIEKAVYLHWESLWNLSSWDQLVNFLNFSSLPFVKQATFRLSFKRKSNLLKKVEIFFHYSICDFTHYKGSEALMMTKSHYIWFLLYKSTYLYLWHHS